MNHTDALQPVGELMQPTPCGTPGGGHQVCPYAPVRSPAETSPRLLSVGSFPIACRPSPHVGPIAARVNVVLYRSTSGPSPRSNRWACPFPSHHPEPIQQHWPHPTSRRPWHPGHAHLASRANPLTLFHQPTMPRAEINMRHRIIGAERHLIWLMLDRPPMSLAMNPFMSQTDPSGAAFGCQQHRRRATERFDVLLRRAEPLPQLGRHGSACR